MSAQVFDWPNSWSAHYKCGRFLPLSDHNCVCYQLEYDEMPLNKGLRLPSLHFVSQPARQWLKPWMLLLKMMSSAGSITAVYSPENCCKTRESILSNLAFSSSKRSAKGSNSLFRSFKMASLKSRSTKEKVPEELYTFVPTIVCFPGISSW